MTQLDGLRAIAVAAVVFHHFSLSYFQAAYPYAASLGVRLFFVLSGFLITGILLAARDGVTEGRSSTSHALIFNVGPARELVWWLLTYTLNVKISAQGWFVSTFPHFWSLNVEEQFYIFWPWAVLLLPRRWLMPAVMVMIATTPLGKIAYILSDYIMTSGVGTYVSTWANLDTLGAGALLAILRYRHSPLVDPHGRPVLAVGLGGAVIVIGVNLWSEEARNVLETTALAAVFAWIVLRASAGFTGRIGAALRWKPAAFVGKISYGIYVYHLFVPGLLLFLAGGRLNSVSETGWPATGAAIAATLALSSLSWFVIEKPINQLKERFR
jgi:peptidoglycan/LPS O-acetylase OafA/YrhL